MSPRHLNVLAEEDDDPMLSAINLVDVFLVLVVALLTAVAAKTHSDVSANATRLATTTQARVLAVSEEGLKKRMERRLLVPAP